MKHAKEFFASGYLTSLMHKKGIKKQFLSSLSEFSKEGFSDPLYEKHYTKTNGLIHRYPDRVVLTITNRCFAYCRFCFRKSNWFNFNGFNLKACVEYIKKHRSIREVLVSGGDPFFLDNNTLDKILRGIKEIRHVEVVRIGTRVLSSNPMRVDDSTVNMLKKYKPIWIAAHINHVDEITDEFKFATDKIISVGIPIVSQTVLLNGINDDADTLKKLFCKLVSLGIKPYYLFGCDQAIGNSHFRVSIDKALSIMSQLRGNTSGLCVPTFSFDLPGGGGKIVLEPNRTVEKEGKRYVLKNFEGREYEYFDV